MGDATQPDVWFEPSAVWEIKGAELTASPVHRAAAGQIPGHGGGLSLRFPRFLRVRDDKDVADATTASQLVDMFRKQSLGPAGPAARAGAGTAAASDDDDDDSGEGEGAVEVEVEEG